jgi:hypothetical protein
MIVNNTTQSVHSNNTKNNTTTDENNSNSFDDMINEKSNIENMVADLLSLIKTGLTVSELELLQELLAKASTLVKDGATNAEEQKEIDEMLSAIENAIATLMKRVNGEAIIKNDKYNKNDKASSENSFEERIKAIDSMIVDLKDGYVENEENSNLINELIINTKPNFLNRLELNKSQDMIDKEFEKSEEKQKNKDIPKESMELFTSLIEDEYITNSTNNKHHKKL